MDQSVIMWLIGGLFSVLWGFLKLQNAQQADQIRILFKKHDDSVKEIRGLELKIAQEHYVKGELDTKFDKLERAFSDGFKELGSKFDKLSNQLLRMQDDGK